MDESHSTGERLLTGYFDRFTVEHIHRYAIAQGIARDLDVLDIACGEGYGSVLLSAAAKSVVGVDIDAGVIKHASSKYARPSLRFLTGSADRMPLPDNSVDLVVSFETLEHHDKHEEMLLEVKRVLRPDGLFLISTPDKRNFSDLTGHRNSFHVKELYRDEFFSLVQKHFTNCAAYEQRLAFGSVVAAGDGQAATSRKLDFYSGDHNAVTRSDSLVRPTYHLALASNGPLLALTTSLFDGQIVLDRWISDSDRIEPLESRVRALTTELTDLKNSFSFRLGAAIVRPLRLLFHRN